MKFQYIKHGSKVVHSVQSVDELPFDVQKGIYCVAWECEGFIGVNYNHQGRDFDGHLIYDQVMPLDMDALNWIKSNFKVRSV